MTKPRLISNFNQKIKLTEPKHEDWPKIIAEIESAGITHYKIACMMRRQFVQVTRWKDGVEPRHYEGQMLLAIHAEYVPRETLQNEPSRQHAEVAPR